MKAGTKQYLETGLIPLGTKTAKSEVSFISLSAADCGLLNTKGTAHVNHKLLMAAQLQTRLKLLLQSIFCVVTH